MAKSHHPTQRDQRAFALQTLQAVRAWPHLDKEKLFSDSMAFYKWLRNETSGPDDLNVYTVEFAMHHAKLIHGFSASLQEAGFITWFVENGLHKLPLLEQPDNLDEEDRAIMRRTRFTSPCFRLPTTAYEDTYLVQWLFWHLSTPPDPDQPPPPPSLLHKWTYDLMQGLPDTWARNFDELDDLKLCSDVFFYWCRVHLTNWNAMQRALLDFAACEPDLVRAEVSLAVFDAHFILWFAQVGLGRQEVWLTQEKWRSEEAS